jgi:hypothetical protein
MDTPCKTDPRAPHGFHRSASHDEGRYVCECEYWESPEDEQKPKPVTCSFCCESSANRTDEFIASQETHAVICVKCIKVCIDIINEGRAT